MEFHVDVECPHCGEEQTTCATFNELELGPEGGRSHPMHEDHCQNEECDKEFWYYADLRMECEFEQAFTKKPKKKGLR